MNFLLAWFIFSILFFIWVKPIWINDKIDTNLNLKLIPTKEQALESWAIIKELWVILYPIEGSIAEKSSLKKWDILYQIHTCESKMWNWVICEWWESSTVHIINNPSDAIKVINNNKWKDVAFFTNANVLNKEDSIKYKADYIGWGFVWVSIPQEWKIWTYLAENIKINEDFEYKYGFLWSMQNWLIETKNQIFLTFKWLWILIKKIFNPEKPEERQEAIDNLSWPIWIVDFISNSISAWFVFIIIIWAIISINLGVFNLLPIPALDWGRFIFITVNWLIQKIFWKKIISDKTEWIIHVLFFILLIALSLIIAYNDLSKIFNN